MSFRTNIGSLLSTLGLTVMLSGPVQAEKTPEAALQLQGIRAQITAPDRTTLGAEMAGRIRTLHGEPGERFKKGSLLAQFDCAEQEALLRKAKAAEKSAHTELAVSSRLLQLDAGSTLDVSKAEAALAEAQADRAVMEVRVGKCRVTAPFSGYVALRHAAEHQYLQLGAPLLETFSDDALEVRLIVPSRWLARMKRGDQFLVAIEETDTLYTAEVIRTGAVVDPVSQSVEVAGHITTPAPGLLPGMSGWARFPYE